MRLVSRKSLSFLLGAGVIGVLFGWRHFHSPHVDVVILNRASPTRSPRPVQSPSLTQSVQKKPSLPEKWAGFKQSFGAGLEPEFGPNGNLISVRGVPRQGGTRNPNFKPSDAEEVKKRGQEILSSARDLLGLTQDLPFGSPVPRGGTVTAQVFFRETYRGLPVIPEGGLKIDLGPQGELLSLTSDYVPRLNVIFDFKISLQDAEEKALNRFDRSSSSSSSPVSPSEAGNKVIWIVDARQGRAAYQFFIKGREIVVDAGTGDILFYRDRRQQ